MAAAPASGVGRGNVPLKHKIVFVGDSRVGKTSVTTRFVYDTFDTSCQATIGIDFLSKTLAIDDRSVWLQLWDTAGQERFRSVIPSYLRDSSGAVVVYDVTDRASFDNASKWIQQVRDERGAEVVIALVGNKVDLEDKRQVSPEDGRAKAEEAGALFVETCAKTGKAVKELFRQLAAALPGGEIGGGGDRGGFSLNPPRPDSVIADRSCAC